MLFFFVRDCVIVRALGFSFIPFLEISGHSSGAGSRYPKRKTFSIPLYCILFISPQAVEVTLSPFPIIAKQSAEVYISHLDNPGQFYVQLSSTEADLEYLAEQSAEIYDGPNSDSYRIDHPEQVT